MTGVSQAQVDEEVLQYLSPSARPDVRAVALQYFLGLTGTPEGQYFIVRNDKYLNAVIAMMQDDQPAIAKDAYLALVNLTTVHKIVCTICSSETPQTFFSDLLSYILKDDSLHADFACMILSNLTRVETCAEKIVGLMTSDPHIGFDKIINVFTTVNYNKNSHLHHLGMCLSNLTQIKEARKYVLDKTRCVIQKLLPYTQYKKSLLRRGGIIGTIKNCMFETEYHEWLLSDSVDILPRLLLPLAGPEEFDEDDMDRLPSDLQYLEPDKEREPDPDLRKMLVEAVNQLLTTKSGRCYVQGKNAYVIMRELDIWEEDPACSLVISNVISVLIADDPEPGMENLHEVEIPEDVEVKLQTAYDLQQKEVEEETKQMDDVQEDG